ATKEKAATKSAAPEIAAASAPKNGHEPKPAAETPAPKATTQDRSIRVNVEILDMMGLVAGDLLVESSRSKLRTGELSELLERFSRLGDRFLKLCDELPKSYEGRGSLERLENDLQL